MTILVDNAENKVLTINHVKLWLNDKRTKVYNKDLFILDILFIFSVLKVD